MVRKTASSLHLHKRILHKFARHRGRIAMARQANGIGRKRLGKFGERAHNRRLVTAGKIGTTVAAREKRVAHKGDVPLLGRGEQDDAARRMPRRLDHLQSDIAQFNRIALGKQPRRLARIGRLNTPHGALLLDICARHRHVLSAQLI